MQPVAGEQLHGGGRQSGAAAVALPAAVLPARAGAAVGHHPDVAQLGCDPEGAPVELAVEQESGADPGAESDEHHRRRAGGGAEPPLRERRGVHVVLDHDRQSDPVRDPVGDRRVAPRQVRGEPDATAVRRDEPGQRQPDRAHGVPLRQLRDDRGDRGLERLLAARRGGAGGVDDRALGVDDPGAHARATHVHPDRQHDDTPSPDDTRSTGIRCTTRSGSRAGRGAAWAAPPVPSWARTTRNAASSPAACRAT